MRILRCCALVVLAWLAGTSVAEARQCSFTLTPTTFAVGSTREPAHAQHHHRHACSWTAVSAVGWITVSSGATGSGIGSVTFTVEQNPQARREPAR